MFGTKLLQSVFFFLKDGSKEMIEKYKDFASATTEKETCVSTVIHRKAREGTIPFATSFSVNPGDPADD